MEQYFNNYATTVASGGYTSGSHVLNVGATSPITLNTGDTTHLLVYRIISGIPTFIVLLKATAVNSSTQFAVTAEGSDSNALVNDNVICVYSAAALDQIRQDINGYGATSSVPTNASRVSGSRFKVTDGNFDYIYDSGASLWVPYFRGIKTAIPNQTFSWINQNSASITTETDGSLYLAGTANAGASIQARVFSTPATPYKYKFIFTPVLPGHTYAHAGILFTDGTKVSELDVIVGANLGAGATNASSLSGAHYTNFTTFSAGISLTGGNILIPAGQPVVFGLGDDGSNKTFYFYPDGYTEIQVFQETHTNFLTPSQIGFFYDDNSANIGGGLIVHGILRTV